MSATTLTTTYTDTITSIANGTDAVAVVNETMNVTFGGTWVAGDTWAITMTDNLSSLETTFGYGYLSGASPTYCFAYNGKVYLLGGTKMFCSALDEPTVFNDPNASGNGYIDMASSLGNATTLSAMASYQGKLAFFTRDSILIWSVDANLANWSIQQILSNIGTIAGNSVQSLGDLDVIFLADTGIRSLRVRDSSLNGFITDMGSPLDIVIQTSLRTESSDATNACAIVDPTNNRYWLFLNGLIYVLSYFPSNKIIAWSCYHPTYENDEGVQTSFTVSKFVTYSGQVFARGTDNAIYSYGGSDNNTYDNCHLKVQTPFLELGSPAFQKTLQGLDYAINANGVAGDTFVFYYSTDRYSAGDPTQDLSKWKMASTSATSSFDLGIIPCSGQGTHVSLYVESQGDVGPAIFNEALLHYSWNEEKG